MILEKVYDELNARIDSIERMAGGEGSDISELETAVSALDVTVNGTAEADGLVDKVSDLETAVSTLDETVNGTAEVDGLVDDMAQAQQDILSLQEAITTEGGASIIFCGNLDPSDSGYVPVKATPGKAYLIYVMMQIGSSLSDSITLHNVTEPAKTIDVAVDANHAGIIYIVTPDEDTTSIGVNIASGLTAGKYGFVVVDLNKDIADLNLSAQNGITTYSVKDGQTRVIGTTQYSLEMAAPIVIAACVDGANWDHSVLEISNPDSQGFSMPALNDGTISQIVKAKLNRKVNDRKAAYMKLTQSYAQGAFIYLNNSLFTEV